MTVDETPRVRVLRVIARLNIGGPTRHVAVLGETLPDLGFDTLLAHGSIGLDEGSLEELVEAKRLRLVRVPGLGRPVHALRDLGAFVDLVRLTFSYRPDIVHTHTAKGGALGRLAAGVYNLTRQRRQRCLVVHTFHGHVLSGYFGPAGSTTIRAVERVLARLTDRIIAISPTQREEIGGRFHIAAPAKISVVPLGFDLDPFLALDEASPTLRKTLALEPHHLAIGYVGRLVPIKDLPSLLRAFARALPSIPQARLVLAGDGEARDGLRALVEELQIAEYVRFAGWVRDLPALYQSFDIVALSSLNEGTPSALIEAMAAGRAVVATAVGGVPDLIEDGETGLLIPPSDLQRLADALVHLAGHPAERRRLGLAARGAVARRFGRARLAADMAGLYRRGLAHRRGA
jgi:glycosyltransferase involved in cell wall biosynthesis